MYGYGSPPQGYGYGYAPQGYGYAPPQGYGDRGAPMPMPYGPPPTMQGPGYGGKRKALLIGINYVGSSSALNGCWNDAHNMSNFIQRYGGYSEDDIVMLTDEPNRPPRAMPTRGNMVAAMNWLVAGAAPGDALFFHYSGHGGQARATEGDEADGYNETILPVDFEMSGQMEDDELHMLLVRPLPYGCRLTALFDSCHSGTALDLPYVYATSGRIKEQNLITGVGKGVLGAAMDYARGDIGGMVSGLFSTFRTATNTGSAEDYTKQTRSSGADVIMLSGCKDCQTSADATEAGKATGAMSWAFVSVLSQYPQVSYVQLLNLTRDLLASKYSQKPQMSASHPIDMNQLFVI